MSGSENKMEKLGHLVKVNATTDTCFHTYPPPKYKLEKSQTVQHGAGKLGIF